MRDKRLNKIRDKIEAGIRLAPEDARLIFESNDIIGIGAIADHVRRKKHGNKAFYVYNQHINYTNVCINHCRFCAYSRESGQNGAFTLSVKAIEDLILSRIDEPINEIHMVGGINPALPFDYYIDLLKTIKRLRPTVTIKAFTAVEIDHFATISGLGMHGTLDRLKSAGLEMMPGGGAEVMSRRIHDALFPRKIDGDRWLSVMAEVHRAGIISNATMLYGHIETIDERIDHLVKLRELQDATGGFSAFIPLAFHAQNTAMSEIPPTTAFDDLKTIAAARLMLDNFDHIKAYWVMIGEKLAQTALAFGADDLDGTIIEEKITHMAGATSARGLSPQQIEEMITTAGFIPVKRDSFYSPISETK